MGKTLKLLWVATAFVSLALIASACIAAGQPAAPASSVEPTYYITRFVTQIIATQPTYTPYPTLTPSPWPTPTLKWDPFAAPIYFPDTGCAASRLQKGGMAFVAQTDAAITRLFSSPEIADNPGMRPLVTGEKLYIFDDENSPWCENKMLIWLAYALSDQKQGFVVEGDGKTYWLLPMSPAEPTPKVKKINP